MISTIILLLLVTAQRLGELVYARANEKLLKAKGAVEIGAAHYPLIVLLHGAWLVALWVFGWNNPLNVLWTGIYVLLQVARGWVLGSIGRRWTTRVFVIPGETLVAKGPYRLIPHPNYTVVALEMIVLPLAVRVWWAAVLFGGLNLLMLWWRIRVEGRALAEMTQGRGEPAHRYAGPR
ncbi:isoprenylcysteine carboxylmethyltransferase family protein [soil metagenome]